MTDLVGSRIGRYEVVALLGRGGMAEVYRARDPLLGRDVAIKLILPAYAQDTDFQRRFDTEARALATLAHTSIVTLYDFGNGDTGAYLVMAYVPGGTLKDRLKAQNGPVMPQEAVRIVKAIAAALDHAHQKGVVHRDVKPSNILFTADDMPVLTDFGIARVLDATQVTIAHGLTGTPAYMAPEQAIGNPVRQSDFYALAVVLFELLTGRTPFSGASTTELALKHQQSPPPAPSALRPELPAVLDTVLARALAKDPAARFNTGAEFSAALDTALSAQQPPVASTDKQTPPEPKTAAKSRARLATNAIGALVGRQLATSQEDGVLGRAITLMGSAGIVLTALQFLVSSIETVGNVSALLVRYFPLLAVAALFATGALAARAAWVSPRYRRRALATLSAVAVVGLAWGGWRVYDRNRPRTGPLILIAQFAPCNGCPDKIFDRDVYNELLNRAGTLPDAIDVKRLRASEYPFIETSQQARALGAAEGASVVIWGGYEPGLIVPHYEILEAAASTARPDADTQHSLSYKLTESVGAAHAADAALGLLRYAQGDPAGMLTWLQRAIDNLPADQQAATAQPLFYLRASANLSTGASAAAIVADLLKATAGTANAAASHKLAIAYTLGCTADGANQYDLALQANDTAIQAGRRDAAVYAARGSIMAGLGRWQDAADAYESVLSLGGASIDVRASLVRAYRLLGREADAARVESTPPPAEPTCTTTPPTRKRWLPQIWPGTNGDFEQAAQLYGEGAQHAPSKDDQAQLNFYAGLSHLQSGDAAAGAVAFEASEKAVARHLGIRSRYAESLHTLLGATYAKLGQPDKALAAFERALQIKPCDAEALLGQGAVLIEQRRFEDAISVFERAEKADPLNGAAAFNLGMIRGNLNSPQDQIDAAFIDAERKYREQAAREPGNTEIRTIAESLRYYRVDAAASGFISAVQSGAATGRFRVGD